MISAYIAHPLIASGRFVAVVVHRVGHIGPRPLRQDGKETGHAGGDLIRIVAGHIAPEARLPYLQAKKAEREKIQARVKELSDKRQAFIQEEMAKQQLDDSQALDRALKDAVREQATANGFTFE